MRARGSKFGRSPRSHTTHCVASRQGARSASHSAQVTGLCRLNKRVFLPNVVRARPCCREAVALRGRPPREAWRAAQPPAFSDALVRFSHYTVASKMLHATGDGSDTWLAGLGVPFSTLVASPFSLQGGRRTRQYVASQATSSKEVG